MTLQTERLLLRALIDEDVDVMHTVYGDPEIVRWVGDGTPLPHERCIEWLAVTRRNYATRGYGMMAVVRRDTGQVIGFAGLVHPGGQPEAEIKYAFLKPWWGQGIATETVSALLTHGATAFGLQEIIATVNPANHASQQVLRKAGMQHQETRSNDDGSCTEVFRWQRQ